jgi:hypothetical protein
MISPYLITIAASLLLLDACQSGGNKGLTGDGDVRSVPEANGDFFQKVSPQTGISFKHTIGDGHLDNLVETVGGGAAFLDYDQDGYIDLYVCSGTYLKGFNHSGKQTDSPGNRLYRNNQDGTFEDGTQNSGVDGGGAYSMGITIGDYNNDGYPDIYVCNYGPNILYKNNGDGTFTDVSKIADIEGNECSVGAVWVQCGWIMTTTGCWIFMLGITCIMIRITSTRKALMGFRLRMPMTASRISFTTMKEMIFSGM